MIMQSFSIIILLTRKTACGISLERIDKKVLPYYILYMFCALMRQSVPAADSGGAGHPADLLLKFKRKEKYK